MVGGTGLGKSSGELRCAAIPATFAACLYAQPAHPLCLECFCALRLLRRWPFGEIAAPKHPLVCAALPVIWPAGFGVRFPVAGRWWDHSVPLPL